MNNARIALLVVVVIIASAATAWFFGAVASMLYGMQVGPYSVEINDPVARTGQIWGAFTGVVAAAIWCRIIIPKGLRSAGRKLAGPGATIGLAVGVLANLLLHLGLALVSNIWHPIPVLVGLVCGVVAGAVVGAICGALCGAAIRAGLPDVPPDGREGPA